MKFKNIINITFLLSTIFFAHNEIFAAQLILDIGGIYTIPPKQVIKEVTASNYLFLSENDFDRDGRKETIVGANCVESFCDNYVFRHLNNKRYQYLGMASFQQDNYELVWKEKAGTIYPDILFFKLENIGQGCLGRYHYVKSSGYQLDKEVCRLPRIVSDLLSTYGKEKKVITEPNIKTQDPDFIDFSNLKYDDKPEDFFPEEAITK